MDMSKIVNGAVHGMIDRLELLDEDADHCKDEPRALFSIAYKFRIEAFEIDAPTRFHHRAIQHTRQFFVSHPNLRHGCPLEDFDRPSTHRSRGIAILGPNILTLGLKRQANFSVAVWPPRSSGPITSTGGC